jgi:hypothetical protein
MIQRGGLSGDPSRSVVTTDAIWEGAKPQVGRCRLGNRLRNPPPLGKLVSVNLLSDAR